MFLIKFNEANFDLIKKYIKKYPHLKAFNHIVSNFHEVNTMAEQKYENLEPWIQWTSFQTGLCYEEHKVFHLGESSTLINKGLFHDLAKTHKVGIFGLMNHPPIENAKYYIPDPWATYQSDPSLGSKSTQKVLKMLVNSNAMLKSPFKILKDFLIFFFSIRSSKKYKILFLSIKAFAKKDRALLASYFDGLFLLFGITKHKSKKLDFSGLFMNGFAHVQHHYMLSSEFYPTSNPAWYVKKGTDPILKSLQVYDEIFQEVIKSKVQFSVITALTQEPYKNPLIYWRFIDHHRLLKFFLDIDFECVPRMTRDFHLIFNSVKDAQRAQDILKIIKIKNDKVFTDAFGHFDLNDKELFLSFIYSSENQDVQMTLNNTTVDLKNEIVFVAIKNGGHDARGWAYIPNNISVNDIQDPIKIWNLGKFFYNYVSTLKK
jgi:hypothetical protein